ncbi:MAG: hypothetical protein WC607_03905 [Candidatus Micrarchaeia archaeon]
MRAQSSIELFLALSLFVLALYWFANQAAFAQDTSKAMAVSQQVGGLASDLALVTGLACARLQAVDYALPEFTDGYAEVDYAVNFSENRVLVYTLDYYPPAFSQAEAGCTFSKENTPLDGNAGVCLNASTWNAPYLNASEGSCS